MLCAGNHPDHSAISLFRKTHLAALGNLFHQILKLCQEAGLVKLGHVALDGTKIKANASKHKANSYSGLERNEDKLVAEIQDLLKKAAEEDAAEDERFGRDRTGDELPDELRRREDRLRVIEQAKAALEADAALTKALERKEQAAKSAAKARESEGDKSSDARAEKAADLASEAAQEAIDQAKKIAVAAANRAQELKDRASDASSKSKATLAAKAQQKAEETLAATEALLSEDDEDTESCLLYTSPSPRDQRGSRMPSSA